MIHVGHILESELLSYPLDSDGLLRKKKGRQAGAVRAGYPVVR